MKGEDTADRRTTDCRANCSICQHVEFKQAVLGCKLVWKERKGLASLGDRHFRHKVRSSLLCKLKASERQAGKAHTTLEVPETPASSKQRGS